MAKRKQTRPSRPGGSAAPTDDNVTKEYIVIEDDHEEIRGGVNDVKQVAQKNGRKGGRFKNTSGKPLDTSFLCIQRIARYSALFQEPGRLPSRRYGQLSSSNFLLFG